MVRINSLSTWKGPDIIFVLIVLALLFSEKKRSDKLQRVTDFL